MGAADLEEFAQPALAITLGGVTYQVAPPSVGEMGQLLAAAVMGEVRIGLVAGPIPEELQRVLDSIAPDAHPALGDVYHQMVADGLSPVTIDRASVYATYYWTRGADYAGKLAKLLWKPLDTSKGQPVRAVPKDHRQPRSGPRTASVRRTKKAGSRTTAPSR